MSDNERIAEAMGWELDDGGDALDRLAGEIPATWVNHERNEYRDDLPDYKADPALLGEMLEWLAERYGVAIERVQFDGFRGYWNAQLYLRAVQVYDDYDDQNAELQQAVARCVLWALEQE